MIHSSPFSYFLLLTALFSGFSAQAGVLTERCTSQDGSFRVEFQFNTRTGTLEDDEFYFKAEGVEGLLPIKDIKMYWLDSSSLKMMIDPGVTETSDAGLSATEIERQPLKWNWSYTVTANRSLDTQSNSGSVATSDAETLAEGSAQDVTCVEGSWELPEITDHTTDLKPVF